MDKQIMLAGIVAIITIVTIVLVIDSSLTGLSLYGEMLPAGMQLRTESGVEVFDLPRAINNACWSTINCNGRSTYVCCSHDGTSCVLPGIADQRKGSCPLTHRSRCQCKEDFTAGLEEEYG